MAGTAMCIVLAAMQINKPEHEVYLGLFAYAAVLGIFETMHQRKILLIILGILAFGFLGGQQFIANQFNFTNTLILQILLGFIWLVFLLFFKNKN